jgi:hypothetical protein
MISAAVSAVTPARDSDQLAGEAMGTSIVSR